MLTAKTDNRTETESVKAGIDYFIRKPFEPDTLRARIHMLLKGRKAMQAKIRAKSIVDAESKPIEAVSPEEKTLAKIATIVEENISNPSLNVNLVCEKSGLAEKQLYRLVKKYLEVSPVEYIKKIRLRKSAALLEQATFNISEVSYMVGFSSPSYFSACFQKEYGMTPSQFMAGKSINS